MTTATGYKKQVSYLFYIREVEYALTPNSETGISDVEDTRKNGQEDSHQSGAIRHNGTAWEWFYGSESFDEYGSNSSADILAYVNANPVPTEKPTDCVDELFVRDVESHVGAGRAVWGVVQAQGLCRAVLAVAAERKEGGR